MTEGVRADAGPDGERGQEASDRQRRKVKRALPALFALGIFGHIIFQSFNLVYQNVGESLHMLPEASLLVSLPGVALAAVCMFYDTLCDYVSPRTIVCVGTLVLVASSVGGFLGAKNFWVVLVCRIFQTIAVHASVVLVILVKYLPKKDRGIYIGFNNAAYFVSVVLGMLLGGQIDFIPWKYILLVPALSIFLLPILLKDVPRLEVKPEPFDGAGATLFTVCVAFLTIFFTYEKAWLLLVSCLLFAAFVVWTKKSRNPLLTGPMLKSRAFMGTLFILFLTFFFQYAAIPIYKTIGKSVYHRHLESISWLLALVYLICVIAASLSGALCKKIGNWWSILLSLGLMLLGFAASALVIRAGFATVTVFMIVYEVGLTLVYTPIYDIATSALHESQRGRGVGIAHVAMNVSPALGIAVYSAVEKSHIGSAELVPRLSMVFWLMAALSALSIICTLGVYKFVGHRARTPNQ
ncbi:MAG: MFS transporter [Aeriscardovia sp.]|nr:MFS transporter [Aeriscardovia sp.]MBQ1357425.1 MFS transporter [Aeriscardovia sp.]MBQ1425062.1 MFS transporter [Aeriscardovia sp.]MBQ5493064.1 MFS transporter [Aeriscardovia sp.]MBQ5520794.1 MFS transporter [Aeriscardovia sp.]